MSNKYEVIIIGAGPAGLRAAEVLAKNKKKVLVFERSRIPGNKVCAGGLTRKSLKELKAPKSVIGKAFNFSFLYLYDNPIKVRLKEPFLWTINRQKLSEWQLNKAKKAGAHIKLNCTVTKVSHNYVLTSKNQKFHFKYLIGADGANSIVRKFLGLDSKNLLLAIQYLSKTKRKNVEIYFDHRKFGFYYTWIFPHKTFCSVGTLIELKSAKVEKIKNNLDNWCQKHKINLTGCQLQAAVINCDYQGVEFGNIFLSGDAAGTASAVGGEGIYQAVLSGNEVAKKILDPSYNLEKLNKVMKRKQSRERFMHRWLKNLTPWGISVKSLSFLLKNPKFKEKITNFITNKLEIYTNN